MRLQKRVWEQKISKNRMHFIGSLIESSWTFHCIPNEIQSISLCLNRISSLELIDHRSKCHGCLSILPPIKYSNRNSSWNCIYYKREFLIFIYLFQPMGFHCLFSFWLRLYYPQLFSTNKYFSSFISVQMFDVFKRSLLSKWTENSIRTWCSTSPSYQANENIRYQRTVWKFLHSIHQYQFSWCYCWL